MPRKKKQEQAEAAPAVAAHNGPPLSKMDAVRTALAEGQEYAAEAVSFIKERFGLDITPQHFNTYKSKIKSGHGTGKKRGRKPGGKHSQAAAGIEMVPVRQRISGIDIETIRQVRQLCDRFGAGAVKRLVSLVG
jgi:hypothetical protein